MADNLTQVFNTIASINSTFDSIATTNILDTAIESGNESTGGWLGIFIFIIMASSVLINLIVFKNDFGAIERTTRFMVFLTIILDIGFYLFKWKILLSIQLLVFSLTLYFVVVLVSFFKKELISGES